MTILTLTLALAPFVSVALAVLLIRSQRAGEIANETEALADTQRRNVMNGRTITPSEEASWTGIPAAA